MRAIKYRELKRMYELCGPEPTAERLREALEEGHLKAEDFSIRELAEATVGPAWVKQLDPRNTGGVRLLEAGDAVDVTAFSNITGQIIYSTILAAYAQEAFILSQLVEAVPTRLDGEKIPGIGRLADDVAEVRPGMPYPSVGLGEDYIETPSTTKRGFIVPVTREAVFFDRTHLVLQRAAEVGEILGLNKEKRLLDLLIGVDNNYKWKGTQYNTYYGPTDGGPWTNVLQQELVNWTNLDAAEQLFADILDPNTGEPVLIQATTLLVMPAYRHAAARILSATELIYGAEEDQVRATYANPYSKTYQFYESRLAYRRIIASGQTSGDAKKWWFLGDFRKAFAYMQNWPITVTQSPPNSDADFNQDVVIRFKASERGAAAVINPRYIVKSVPLPTRQ
ncbi:MAG: hypothetical protein ABSF26_19710 [Thermoguttaceae bacterium]